MCITEIHVEAGVALNFTECLNLYSLSKPCINEASWKLSFKSLKGREILNIVLFFVFLFFLTPMTCHCHYTWKTKLIHCHFIPKLSLVLYHVASGMP